MGSGYTHHKIQSPKQETTMIGLADCNNFFVSCERVFRPDLTKRPVIVLSNNDGCAVALSAEAKSLGFRRGDPYFKIRQHPGSEALAVFSSNHRLYGDMSARVMTILRSLVSKVDVYSIDEAFLEIDDSITDFADFAGYVVAKVRHDTGIPVSIGIAPTKTLAKIASHFAKRYKGYKGVCIIDTPAKTQKALELTDIGDVWGIGRRLTKRLRQYGINTALELASLPKKSAEAIFNITGMRTWRELNGCPCISIDIMSPERKTITSSRSFAAETNDFGKLRQALAGFATIAARKLRENGGYALEVETFISTNRFHRYAPQYFNSAAVALLEPTDFPADIIKAADTALKRIYRPEFRYKKAGITISRIAPTLQPTLFTDLNKVSRLDRLMRTVDAINRSCHTPDTVRIASMGNGFEDMINQKYISKLYTTRINDIITVHT